MHMNIISHHEVNSKDFDWIWNEWAKDMRTVVIAIALINQYSAIFIFWYFSIVWNRLFEIGIWMVVYMLMMYGMICFCVYVPPEHAHLCLYLLICLFAYLLICLMWNIFYLVFLWWAFSIFYDLLNKFHLQPIRIIHLESSHIECGNIVKYVQFSRWIYMVRILTIPMA